MGDQADPHIHVDARLRSQAVVRGILASTFGLTADSPTTVNTGCGLDVPLAMTSVQPEKVTCLACREYAHRRHLNHAEHIEQFSRIAGSVITSEQGSAVAAWHRDQAKRFT